MVAICVHLKPRVVDGESAYGVGEICVGGGGGGDIVTWGKR